MKYSVQIKKSAEREMDHLPTAVHARVSEKILALEINPRPPGSIKLKGGEGYRLRVGNYRVLYTVEDKTRQVLIFSVAHRREAYR